MIRKLYTAASLFAIACAVNLYDQPAAPLEAVEVESDTSTQATDIAAEKKKCSAKDGTDASTCHSAGGGCVWAPGPSADKDLDRDGRCEFDQKAFESGAIRQINKKKYEKASPDTWKWSKNYLNTAKEKGIYMGGY